MALIFSRKDYYCNFDRWLNGENNLLIVTGISGSGKSTLAQKLCQEYGAMYLDFDALGDFQYIEGKNPYVDEIIKIFYQRYPEMRDEYLPDFIHKNQKFTTRYNRDYYRNGFILIVMEYANLHAAQRFVFEGNSIMDYFDGASLMQHSIIFRQKSVWSIVQQRKQRAKIKKQNQSMTFEFYNDGDFLPLRKLFFATYKTAYRFNKKLKRLWKTLRR